MAICFPIPSLREIEDFVAISGNITLPSQDHHASLVMTNMGHDDVSLFLCHCEGFARDNLLNVVLPSQDYQVAVATAEPAVQPSTPRKNKKTPR